MQAAYVQNSRNRVEAGLAQWQREIPAPSELLDGLLGCDVVRAGLRRSPNISGFCDRETRGAADAARARARRHAAEGRRAASGARSTGASPTSPCGCRSSIRSRSTSSPGASGNYRWSPQLHLMPSLLWVQVGERTPHAGPGRRVELTGLRRGTVRSMSVSAVVPQFTLQRDVPTAGLRELRKALKASRGAATLTDVITMACARALREHPGVNASYGDDCVIEHERVNIGLALALDDGLTVPVILDADALLARGARGRAAAARRGGAHAHAARRGDLRRHVQHLEPRAARRRPLPGARAAAAGRDPGRRLAARDRQPLGVVRSPRRRRRAGGALPRDDRTPARGARRGRSQTEGWAVASC